MTAGILGKVEHLQVLAKKQDRRLKDIHVWCQWATGNFGSSKKTEEITEYSGFTASQAYTSNDMRNLLHSSGSVLSLQLGDLCDDSVSMIWTPESASTMPPRRVKSVLSPKQPSIEDLKSKHFIAVANLPSQSLEGVIDNSPLQNLADIYALAERSQARRSRRMVSEALEGMTDIFRVTSTFFGAGGVQGASLLNPLGLGTMWSVFETHLMYASAHNQSMIDDLGEIRNVIMTMDIGGGDLKIDEKLQGVKDAVLKALAEYMTHATKVFRARTSMPHFSICRNT